MATYSSRLDRRRLLRGTTIKAPFISDQFRNFLYYESNLPAKAVTRLIYNILRSESRITVCTCNNGNPSMPKRFGMQFERSDGWRSKDRLVRGFDQILQLRLTLIVGDVPEIRT